MKIKICVICAAHQLSRWGILIFDPKKMCVFIHDRHFSVWLPVQEITMMCLKSHFPKVCTYLLFSQKTIIHYFEVSLMGHIGKMWLKTFSHSVSLYYFPLIFIICILHGSSIRWRCHKGCIIHLCQFGCNSSQSTTAESSTAAARSGFSM